MTLSELMEFPVIPAEQWISIFNSSSLGIGKITTLWNSLQSKWPVYPKDIYFEKLPITQTPILMLSGSLDANTPPEIAEIQVKYLPSAKNVVFPFTTHIQMKHQCGQIVGISFIKNYAKNFDATCVFQMPPLDFTGRTDFPNLNGTDLFDGVI